MRITKQNKIIVGVISLALVLTIGYALFSETLNINGTAKASGNFNLIFSEVLRNDVKKEGATIDVDNITIKDESKTLSIGDVTLNYPTAYVKVPAMIRNEGTIDAVLKGIRVENPNASEIEVSYDGVKKDELFKSKEEKEITITIRWKEESKTPVEKQDFNIFLDYEQAPEGYTPPVTEEMTRDMFVWDSETVVAGLSDKGIEHLRNNGGKLVIPEGTTEIASASWNYQTNEGEFDKGFSPMAIGKLDLNTATEEEMIENMFITSVKLPSTLKKIGMGAFMYNMNLTGILKLPEKLEEIGVYAFGATGIIGELIIPNSVKTLDDAAFGGTKITSVKLGSGIKTIEDWVFSTCENLVTILNIPNNIEKINLGAFFQCNSLKGELYIPDSVETIEIDAFAIENLSDNKLTNISISKNTSFVKNSNYQGSFYNRPTPTIRD